jgi:DNA repair exonuclease SbcCD nuclease subunit
MVGTGMNFDTDTYKELFNGFLKDPTQLAISGEKPIVEMSNEELTAWINKLEDFVRIAKVAKQAAHVTLEDRRLQMTEEQRAEQRRLDLKYKPATVKTAPKKERKTSSKKLSPEQKMISATIDILECDKAKAISWLKAKGKLPADYPEE